MRSLRAGGSLLILALFPLFLLGLIAALVWVVYLAFSGHHGAAGIKLLLLVVPLGYALLTAVRQVLAARPSPASGHEITRAEHPRLWAAADDAASGVGTSPAERLVVVPDVNAAVTQAAGRRELLVGLPLLATLTDGELRSVLAHEFGHFGAGHTRLTSMTWRGHALMQEMAQRTDGAVGWLVGGYAKLATRLTSAASRDQEWEADAYAARLTDPATAASAMRKVVTADLALNAYTQTHFQLTRPAARRAPIAEGLIATMGGRREAIDEAARTILGSDSTGNWSDTHPPLRERIAAFEAMSAGGTGATPNGAADGDRSAYELLEGGLAAFDPIEFALTGDTDPIATWDEVSNLAGRRVMTDRVHAYLAQTGLRDTIHSVDDLLAFATRPDARTVLLPLVASDVPTRQRDEAASEHVIELVGTGVVAALTTSGLARFVVDWSDLWNLVGPDGAEITMRDRVAAVVADASALPDLKSYLVGLGLDLTTPLPELERPTADSPAPSL